ncbi:MAG: cytochrome c oxidase subunit IVB [Bacillaceae bacterium]
MTLSRAELELKQKKHKEEMKHQVVTFALMIFLTFVAFAAVLFKDYISPVFAVPFIILLAIVQVVFQLYYFMHMKHKGHGAPAIFLYGGLVIGLITVLAFMTIVWW